MRLRWPFRRNGREEARERERAAEQAYRAAKQMTPLVQRMAPSIAATLTDAEFAERVARAFRERPV